MFDQLLTLLRETVEPSTNEWLDKYLEEQNAEFHQRKFYYAFSGATRQFPKTTVSSDALPTRDDSFQLANWTVDQLARSVLLQHLGQQENSTYLNSLSALTETADIRESVAIFSTFPLLPTPEALVPLAREALRTNVVDIFDAIALQNPFPAAHFDNEGWNQMVLKAFFLARPIYQIFGLDARCNPDLSNALQDYARERWAAGRAVWPELWRFLPTPLEESFAPDLQRLIDSKEPGNREAATLLIASHSDSSFLSQREKLSDLLPQAQRGELSWDTLGAKLQERP